MSPESIFRSVYLPPHTPAFILLALVDFFSTEDSDSHTDDSDLNMQIFRFQKYSSTVALICPSIGSAFLLLIEEAIGLGGGLTFGFHFPPF